ncbi:CaiB/BaiF CoA transferase family protein [Azospirillum sp.]|uniref:CaiB/BaiF CoA transferase family protein n=1 Tax=Azospirillum sp. TaxID=34012 RepID=UPI003D72C9E4
MPALDDETARGNGPAPLKGYRVLDLTRLLPGAFCTQILADLGAEVIKVEQPGKGDYWRWSEPKVREEGAQFLALNRNKRSITLDLKNPQGREALLRLCETADVVVEGFRPRVMERLRLGAADLHARNPKLVLCAITGFGQTGPWAGMAAHDLNFQALTGMLELVGGRPGRPVAPGIPVGDIGGGALLAVAGILAALLERGRTGRGRVVDIGVADGLFFWMAYLMSQWNAPGQAGRQDAFDIVHGAPYYTLYETADGRHMAAAPYEEKFWQAMCETLGLPDLIDRQWAQGDEAEVIKGRIAAVFRQRTQAEWTEVFLRADACVTPVLTPREALGTPQALARGTEVVVEHPVEGPLRQVACPIRLDGLPVTPRGAPPVLGADTDAVLAAAGYDAAAIAALRAAGAV